MSFQKLNNIQIFTKIQNLYPDIEEELENRHCSLYGKIKVKFIKAYQQQQPEFFINVKAIYQTMKVTATSFNVSMALENGVILAIARTYKNQAVFINSEFLLQQIILSCKGELEQNPTNSELAEWARLGFEVGLCNSLKNNLMGGIIYVENNMPKESAKYKQAYILAFSLACLILNQLQDDFSMQQIQQKIQEIINNKIPKYNQYENHAFLVTDGLLSQQIKLKEHKCKFILCDIQLEDKQIQQLNKRKKLIQIEQRLLEKLICNGLHIEYKPLMDLKREYEIQDIQEIRQLAFQYIQQELFSVEQCSDILNEVLDINHIQYKFNPKKRLQYAIQQYKSINLFVSHTNKQYLQNALVTSYNIMKKQNLLSQKAINLVDLCLSNNALACTIIQHRFLLVLIQKNKMLKLFQLIKNSVFHQYSDDIQQEIPKDLHHLIFSTLPSKGVAILKPDPETQLWFE